MSRHTFLFSVFIMLALMVVVDFTRPILPVDETRYLTVAWEYLSRGEWILPTLNYEPYHHKPPMLFWLINAMWAGTGTESVWAARLVPLLAGLLTIFMTHKIARTLWPENARIADITVLMLLTTPFFMIYSTLIMFDTLLTVAVLIGVYALLKHYLTGNRWYFMLLALAFGLGGLIKGPVVLVHLLPLAIFFPCMRRDFIANRSIWFQGIIFALMIGVMIALAWALPAAKLGGPEYERMIFWGQSAGRVVQAFDHAKPFWFYIILIPAVLLPWVYIPAIWARRPFGMVRTPVQWQTKFLLAWAVPVFIAFSFISGKQVHYLIPILPAVFMILANRLSTIGACERMKPHRLYAWIMAPIMTISIVLLVIDEIAPLVTHNDRLVTVASQCEPLWILISMAFVLVGYIFLKKRQGRIGMMGALRMATLVNVVSLSMLHFMISPMMNDNYDLTKISNVVHEYATAEKPIAVANPWEGELGYTARLPRHVDLIHAQDMRSWLNKHPTGAIIFRHPTDEVPKGFKVIYTGTYRSPGKSMSVLGR